MTEKRGKYLLRAHDGSIGCRIVLTEFPELCVEFLDYVVLSKDEELCVTLRINKRYSVRLSDRDSRRNHATVVGEYEFTGHAIETKKNHTKEEAYILFTVYRRTLLSGSDSGVFGTETRTCRVNDAFILEFIEPGTGDGRTWRLKEPPIGISLVDNVYVPHCVETDKDDQRPGCINTHRFTLKGNTPGQYTIQAIYNKAWLDYGNVGTNYAEEEKMSKSRNFEVTIL